MDMLAYVDIAKRAVQLLQDHSKDTCTDRQGIMSNCPQEVDAVSSCFTQVKGLGF